MKKYCTPQIKQTYCRISKYKMCYHLHLELWFVKEQFPKPDLVGILTQSFSLFLHQYLLLCQHYTREKSSLKKKKCRATWVAPFVSLCWLCSKYRVSVFPLPLQVTIKQSLQFRAKRR